MADPADHDEQHDGDTWVHALDGAWHLSYAEPHEDGALTFLRCTGKRENELQPWNRPRSFALTPSGHLPAQSPLCERCKALAGQQ